jgi:ribosomal protein L7/L12
MNPTVELQCPVCDSNQLTITEKGLMGQTSMSCRACGYTFKSSEAKVAEASPEQQTATTTLDVTSTTTTAQFDKQLLDLLQQKGIIYAVKFCHKTKGWNLKESKKYVDNLANKHGVKGKEGCFVATACYGDYNSPEVLVLRAYRDTVLLQSRWGKVMVKIYYLISPYLAGVIARSGTAKRFIRKNILAPVVAGISRKYGTR